jgi:hypothetical protein
MIELAAEQTHAGHWSTEEFEDHVARALIGLYETNFNPPKVEEPCSVPGHRLIMPVEHRIKLSEWQRLRRHGVYFCPGDRTVMSNHYWSDIDGLPDYASVAYVPEEGSRGSDDFKGYVEIFSAARIPGVPVGCKLPPGINRAIYRLCGFYPGANGVTGFGGYVGVRGDGRIVVPVGTKGADTLTVMGSATLGYAADSRYLWNVCAQEGEAKATFGVYEDQIQSLFYARDTPMSPKGRKRPILHWVSSHQRRLRNGEVYDLPTKLRGITEFVMDGTKFTITNPAK